MRYSAIWTSKGRQTISIHEDTVEKLRDDLRSSLAASSFVVSDIAKYSGSDPDSDGYAFIVKNGAREWLIMTPHSTDPTNYIGRIFTGSTNSGNVGDYFKNYDAYSTNIYDESKVLVHYNCGNESYGMGFDDATALTYTGGDFSAPLHNPASAAYTDFMPATECLPGYYMDITWDRFDRILFVFDEDSPSLAVYLTDGYAFAACGLMMLGSMTVNTDGADTNTEATLCLELDYDSSRKWGSIGADQVYAYNLTGDVELFDLSYTQDHYTYENSLNTSGEYKWKSITLASVSYEKGILDTNLVRQYGAFANSAQYGKIVSGPNGPFLKTTYSLGFPYTLNTERFPWPE